jgi:hypothetical protein
MPSIKNFTYFHSNKKHYHNFDPPTTDSSICNFEYSNQRFSFTTEEYLFDLIKKDNSSTLLSSSNNLIPPGFKYIYKNHIVYERPPTHKLIHCYAAYLDQIESTTKLHSYYIPIPWQLYIAEFDDSTNRVTNVRMYFMNSPLLSEDQILYLPPIPNFYVNSALCRPFFSSLEDIEKYTPDISGIIHASYDWVWSSNFNLDLTETISSIYTQNNPVQIASSDFVDNSYKLYRLNMFHLHKTYSLLETFSLNDVTSFVWPNPAYASFQADDSSLRESLDYYELASQYIDENGLYDEDDFPDYSEFVDYVVENDEGFHETLPKSYSIKKTYSDIINYIISSSDFSSVKNTNFTNSIIKQYTKSQNSSYQSEEEFEPF